MRKRQFKKQQKKLQLGIGRSYKLGKSITKTKIKAQRSNKPPNIISAFDKASENYQKIPEYVRKKGVAYISEYIEYKKLARKADRRLRAIEAYSNDEFYRGIKKYAYARAIRDIELWSGEGSKRFDTKPPESLEGIRAKINDIKTFLEAPSSTKTGITNIYKKRAQTINERYGTKFTWQDIAKYYTSAAHEKAAEMYGSKTELLAFASEINKIDVNKIKNTLDQKYANLDYVKAELKKKGWKVNK